MQRFISLEELAHPRSAVEVESRMPDPRSTMPLLTDEQASGSIPSEDIPLHDREQLLNCVNAEEVKLVPVTSSDSDLLTWRPLQMRTWFLLINAAACIAIIAGIFSLLIGVGGDRTATLTSQTAQILTKYTPTFIGTVTYLIFRSTVSDIFWILPFIRMADQRSRITQGANPQRSIGGSYFPLPFAEYRDSPLVKCAVQILLVITSLLTANKAMLLGSLKIPGKVSDSWKISVHRSSAFYLIGAYTCMAIFYIATAIWLSGKSTGLKWDPASPLDHLALVVNTNALPAIGSLPLTYDHAHKHLEKHGKWRLGYWRRTVDGQATTVYGIGLINPQDVVCRNDALCICDEKPKKPKKPCWFSRPLYPLGANPEWMAFCMLLLLLAMGLLMLAVVKGALDQGFHLNGPWILEQNDGAAGDWVFAGVRINSADSTNVNIVIRGLPTVLTQWYVNTQLTNLSMRLRSNQCWTNLATKPRTLYQSLALKYSTQMSYFVPRSALSKGHYRLAAVSFIAFVGQLWPAFVAGLCSFYRTKPDQVLVTFSLPAFIIVCTFILLSAVALVLGWPFEHETLLREPRSIADNLRPFVHSSITTNPRIKSAATCRTQKEMYANVFVENYLYELNLRHAACKKYHLIVDIVGHQYKELGNRASSVISIDHLVKSRRRHRHAVGPLREWIHNSFSGTVLKVLLGQGVLEQHWFAGQSAPGFCSVLMYNHNV